MRELRNNLSRHLDRVRDGEELVVTDRGNAVARMLPIGAERVLDRLVAEEVVPPAPHAPERRSTGTVSDLVADQRR